MWPDTEEAARIYARLGLRHASALDVYDPSVWLRRAPPSSHEIDRPFQRKLYGSTPVERPTCVTVPRSHT